MATRDRLDRPELTDKVISNLEWLGDRYCREHLSGYDADELLQNPPSALWFVMGSAFQRGRGFDLSNRYFNHAKRVLMSRLQSSPPTHPDFLQGIAPELAAANVQSHVTRITGISCDCLGSPPAQSADLLQALCPHLKEHSARFLNTNPDALPLNNSKDLEMIGGVIHLASRIGNILERLKSLLDEGGPLTAYQYLTSGDGKVRYIGEKIAALVIQDLCLISGYRLASDTDRRELRGLFPVDTLIRNVARAFHAPTLTDDGIKDFFIDHCSIHDPAKIAAGIWYMARNSLDLFIELSLPVSDFRQLHEN
jgi:hypothetical protein